jgi:MerC mercury resistance protein
MTTDSPPDRLTAPGDAMGDGLAAGLSALCLVHCLVLPFLAGAAPLLGVLAEALWVHAVLLLAAAPLSVWVLAKGYAHHRRRLPLVIGILGLVLLTLGLVQPTHLASERVASVLGATFLLLAHGQNFWLRWRGARG